MWILFIFVCIAVHYFFIFQAIYERELPTDIQLGVHNTNKISSKEFQGAIKETQSIFHDCQTNKCQRISVQVDAFKVTNSLITINITYSVDAMHFGASWATAEVLVPPCWDLIQINPFYFRFYFQRNPHDLCVRVCSECDVGESIQQNYSLHANRQSLYCHQKRYTWENSPLDLHCIWCGWNCDRVGHCHCSLSSGILQAQYGLRGAH